MCSNQANDYVLLLYGQVWAIQLLSPLSHSTFPQNAAFRKTEHLVSLYLQLNILQ